MVPSSIRFYLSVLLLVFPIFANAQTAEVAYTVPQAVPVFGSGIALLLGLVMFVSGWVWLKKHPTASRNMAVGAMMLGTLATVTSGGWMVNNANALIATSAYLLSENTSPVVVTDFPAMLENDLSGPATLTSIDVSGCSGVEQITGSCEVGLSLGAEGGSCSLDSVCAQTGQCQTGSDPINGSPWVICSMEQNEAWISADNGGIYNADLICQNLGYSRAGSYGGTCGNVCGYCESTTSCSSPGNRTFDNQGKTSDIGYGLRLNVTVHWLCVNDPS